MRQQLPEQPGMFAGVERASAFRAATARQTTTRQPVQRLNRYPPASPQRAGFHGGLHPEDSPPYSSTEFRERPRQTGDDEEEYNDPPRTPTSSIRRTRNVYPPSMETRRLPRYHFHWLVFAGIALFVMVIGWLALSALGNWWTVQQDDWHYGRPRTFQIDAVVGHNNDSPQNPSHFIALNLDRKVIVLELPAGDASKTIIYTAGTLLGDGQDLTPVTLSFEDRNNDGKPDLNIHIGDQVIVFLNNGEKFVSPQQH